MSDKMIDFQKTMVEISDSITQREWLLITRALDRTRDEINEDGGLQMLAVAWAKEKHERGGASWDKYLDMTDDELLKALGVDVEAIQAEAEAAEKASKDADA